MKMVEFIPEELVVADVRATKKADVIRELAAHLAAQRDDIELEELVAVLTEREKLGSTAIGEGLAIPHGKLDAIDSLVGCFGRSRKGIDFASQDGKPTHFFFLVVAPHESTGAHLKALARISRIFKDREIRTRLLKAGSAREIHDVLAGQDAEVQGG